MTPPSSGSSNHHHHSYHPSSNGNAVMAFAMPGASPMRFSASLLSGGSYRKALVGPYLNGAGGSAGMGGGGESSPFLYIAWGSAHDGGSPYSDANMNASGTRRRRRKRSGCGGRATANNVTMVPSSVVRHPSSSSQHCPHHLDCTYLHNLLADIIFTRLHSTYFN